MTKMLVALIASFVAASCASVRTNVVVTHMLPPAASAKTVAILPYSESLPSAPDFQTYAARLAAHLQQKGYTVVAPSGGPAPTTSRSSCTGSTAIPALRSICLGGCYAN